MKRRVKNHFGFSLIEMVVAFAILGVASLAIGGFFVSSSRSYSSSSSETGLQYEAQMALNQIEGKLIDATLGVNYNLVTKAADANGSTHNYVTSDTIADNLLDSKVLYIFDYKNNAFDALLVKWNIASKELLYKEVSLTNSFNEQTLVSSIPLNGTWELLAEGVTSFSVDLSKYLETKTVDVTMKLAKQRREFETSGTITLRNNVLVNTSKVSDIYKNMSGATATRIDDVFLSANTNITKPGGTIQLTTKVTGVYPSQEIAGWLIAHSYDQTNEYILGTVDPTDLVAATVAEVNANKELLVKQVPEDAVLDTLFVQAYVNIGNGQYKYSNIVTIHVRNITGITILPTADLTVTGNGTLTQAEVDQWAPASTGSVNSTVTHIYPSNVIKMNQFVSGTFNESDQIKVVWSVEEVGEGVIANIDSETGTITVDRHSRQGRYIVKASVQGTEYWAKYAFTVSSPYTNNRPRITVTAPVQMNRGQAAYQCAVKINNAAAYTSDFDWSVRVETSAGQLVTGNPVTINANGLLTVTDALSFDYSYKITVYATMKSDASIYGAAIVTVPRVTMYLSTTEAVTARIGSTIPAGKIICTVVGLEHYDVAWTIAKETNPTYYFTAYGNTNITGSEVKMYAGTANERMVKTPKVVIGADEPSALKYVRVKAALVGHSNYASTLKLTIGQAVNEDVPDSTDPPIYDVTPYVSFTATMPDITNQDSITVTGKVDKPASVATITVNGTEVTMNSDGTFTAQVSVVPGGNVVTVEVTDTAGDVGTQAKTVICDKTPPTLNVVAPEITTKKQVTITGTVADAYGVQSVTVNGIKKDVMLDGSWTATVDVPTTGATVTVVATDKAGNSTTVNKTIAYDNTQVTFDADMPNLTKESSITVTGDVDNHSGVSVRVTNTTNNKVKTPQVGQTDGSFSTSIDVVEGGNVIKVEIIKNGEVIDSIQETVVCDKTAPEVTINAPSTTNQNKITVPITVVDSNGIATVTVNGSNTTVNGANSWSTEIEVDVPTTGATITVVATDKAGNTQTEIKTVRYEVPVNKDPLPNYNGNKYEITGGGTAVRNGSITLSTHYHTDGVGNGPVVVDQNSWKITQVKVKNGEVLPEPYTGIELYPTDTSVNISIDSAFYLEYMDKEIEISVNATVGGRPFANDKVFKVETVKLSKDIKGPKDIYAGSSEYSISLEGIKDGMNEELEKAGLSLVWEIKETKEYVTLGNSLDYGEKVLVNVDDDIDEEDTFKLKVVLKYNNKEYASTERGGLKAKANKPGGGGNGGGRP